MEIVFYIGLVAVVVFLILLNLPITQSLEKSKAYLLPTICGSILLGWTVLSIFILGRTSDSNFYDLSLEHFIDIMSFVGLIAVVLGIFTGILLHFGSLLRLRKRSIAGGILIVFSLILWVVSVLATFVALALWATG